MLRSMTGFARCESNTEVGYLTWEIRTVNHRYLEMYFRLPEDFRALETRFRKEVAKRLRRGKVECALRYRPPESEAVAPTLNADLLKALVDTSGRIAELMPKTAPVSPVELMRWPGVLKEPEREKEPVFETAFKLLDEALTALNESRGSEGGRISEMLLARCDSIAEQVTTVRSILPEVRDRIHARIVDRIEQLDVEPNQDRLEQELVILAQKMDVAEELDRLESHIEEIRKVVKRDEPVGRRLDFLMQELNREANTLSSKSHDSRSTMAAVDVKVFIEQMREQIQNVE